MNRRDFIKLAAATPIMFYAPWSLSKTTMLDTSLWKKKLLLIELKGGNDGLNTVIPYADPQYYHLRPTLAVARDQIIQLNEQLGLNASLSPVKIIWDSNELAIVLGVGYKNPNLSHFRSIEIWNSGSDSDDYIGEGWLTRTFKGQSALESLMAHGISTGFDAGPLQGQDAHNIIMNNPRQFFSQANQLRLPNVTTDNPALAHILHTQQKIYDSALALQQYIRKIPDIQEKFPRHKLGKQLQLAATIILSDAPVTTIKVSLGGFDTHNIQRQKHDRLLKQLAQSLAALRNTLAEHNHWENTLVMTYSEFGRRAGENGSKGTDHGTAAPHLLLGGSVKGGFYGKQPSLTQLNNKNLLHHVDYRQLYATITRDWWTFSSSNPFASYESIKCIKS
ncbi:DUF1501 domain-containing protein [Kaarinaea lacus]